MNKLSGMKKILLGSACAIGVMITSQVGAQVATYYDNNVLIDLSVIDDNGLGNRQPSIANPLSSAKLPPKGIPRSTFHGLPQGIKPAPVSSTSQFRLPENKPQSRIVLKKPAMPTAALPKSKLATTDKIQLKKPAVAVNKPMPKTVEVAKTAPKPIVKPMQMPTVTPKQAVPAAPKKPEPVAVVKAPEPPKPAPAPVKPVEVVKTEAPMEMAKKEAPTPPPAPKAPPAKVMAEAPPPPPPSAVEPKKVETAMKQEEQKPVTTTAAIPPSSDAAVRIAFDDGQSKMPSSAKSDLDKLAESLRKLPDDRVQLLAYAGGETLSASKARRLSLSRALAVRSYLIGKGVRSTRIDVRALGNKTTQEPFDRVDVQVTPR